MSWYGFACTGGVGTECYSPCGTNSNWVEASVAAFLYDLFDTPNVSPWDDSPKVTQADTVTFNAATFLQNWGSYTTFWAFYNDYTARGLWSRQNTAVWQLVRANGVDTP